MVVVVQIVCLLERGQVLQLQLDALLLLGDRLRLLFFVGTDFQHKSSVLLFEVGDCVVELHLHFNEVSLHEVKFIANYVKNLVLGFYPKDSKNTDNNSDFNFDLSDSISLENFPI